MYEFEKKKLYHYLGSDLVELFKKYGCFIAGGAITSLMTNKEINDIDLYFRTPNHTADFIEEVWEDWKGWIVSHTKKATAVELDNITVQMIHFDYFKSAEDIFKTFDFTVCMGAFDFEKEEFIFNENFFKHNSQRILKYNANTAFPIVSMLRVHKYKEKGYEISKPEFIRVMLSCMNLEIETYEELKEQMGGMYGVNYDKLFEDYKDDQKVDLGEVIDRIANLHLDDDYFKDSVQIEFKNVNDILDVVLDKEVEYFKIGNSYYRNTTDGSIRQLKSKPRSGKEIENTYIKNLKLYKIVRKEKDSYFSEYDSRFEYKIGEYVRTKNDHFLHFNELKEIDCSPYAWKLIDSGDKYAVIEASFIEEDFGNKDGCEVLVKGCTVIREVPKEEYEEYLKS